MMSDVRTMNSNVYGYNVSIMSLKHHEKIRFSSPVCVSEGVLLFLRNSGSEHDDITTTPVEVQSRQVFHIMDQSITWMSAYIYCTSHPTWFKLYVARVET